MLSGAGSFDAYALQSDKCEISLSGVDNARVNVREELDATITGLGNIEYIGDPEHITRTITGLGNIRRGRENI